jgi:MOSC domain-containing protein YiiM
MPSASPKPASEPAVTARIFHLAISSGGAPKHAIRDGEVGELGIVGDRQKHTKIHGGPSRALCLYSLELIQKLQSVGHPIYPGSVGENVTISGLPWATLASGTRLALGDQVEIELTTEAEPCKTIAASFIGNNFKRLEAPGEMRWYSKVLSSGALCVAQQVRVISV